MKQPRNSDESVDFWNDEEPSLDLFQALERLSLAESLQPTPEESDNEEF